jgi:uncharacterized protein (TIGR02421 family)
MAKRYRARFPAFLPRIVIRDDLPAGLLVTGDALLISRYTSIPDCRLHALLSHEIGVHLVTHFTGATQPLRIFRSGLAGYEGVQEGLGVFAEFATDGLTMARLRLLAARVIACRAMLEGASFVETFRMLEDTWGFSARAAFNITVRTHRGGGLAKDAIYLRGLIDEFEILRVGGELDAFWIGKIAPHHDGAYQELLHRDHLLPAALRPEFLDDSGARQRIDRARESDDLWVLLRA